MKKLLILPLLFLLSGCVTYYYPETALEDGIYYAEDDPSYNVYQGHYPGYAYYPWSSMDYFYMGYHPYPHYAYYHGFHYGYSPWHYPYGYYGYYSPLYASYYHYPYYPVWRPYNGYCSHYDDCNPRQSNRRGDEQEQLVGTGGDTRRKSVDSDVYDSELATEKRIAELNTATLPYRRQVSTMPSGYSGNQGMVIRSGDSNKIGKSRIQPSKTTPNSNGIVIAAPASTTALTSGSSTVSRSTSPVSNTRSPSTRSTSSGTSRSRSVSSPRTSSGSSSRARSSSRSSGRTTRSSMPAPRKDRD